MKLLFFGDSVWGTLSLRALLDAGHEVVGVMGRKVSSTSCLKNLSEQEQIDYRVFSKVNGQDSQDWISGSGAEMGVSVSYDQIFREPTIAQFPKGIINVHCGKLPNYRGRNILNWALINGEEDFGITVHYVDQGIDTGDIINQLVLPIEDTDDYQTLLDRSVEAIPGLVVKSVEEIEAGIEQARKQLSESGTYFSKRRPGDEWINWNSTSREIFNFIRGITRPAPGARTSLNGKTIIIWKAEFKKEAPKYRATPGEVVAWTQSKDPIIKTADSTIALLDYDFVDDTQRLKMGSRFISLQENQIKSLEERLQALEEALSNKS